MKTFRSLFAAAVACLALATSYSATVGKAAPAFSLTDIDGNSHSLSDFAGKVVVLEWVNFGCPYVKKFYNDGHMQAFQKSAGEKEVVWLSVCSSSAGAQGNMSSEDWQAAHKSKGMASTVLLDNDGVVGKAYGARTTPHMYVINEAGVLVYNGAIDSVRSTDAADVETAENYVFAAIDSLLAGEVIKTTMTKPYGCGVKYAR